MIIHHLKNISDNKHDDNAKKDSMSQEKIIVKNFTSLDCEFKAYSIALQTLNMTKNHGFKIEEDQGFVYIHIIIYTLYIVNNTFI